MLQQNYMDTGYQKSTGKDTAYMLLLEFYSIMNLHCGEWNSLTASSILVTDKPVTSAVDNGDSKEASTKLWAAKW